jgi:hypothetical protein
MYIQRTADNGRTRHQNRYCSYKYTRLLFDEILARIIHSYIAKNETVWRRLSVGLLFYTRCEAMRPWFIMSPISKHTPTSNVYTSGSGVMMMPFFLGRRWPGFLSEINRVALVSMSRAFQRCFIIAHSLFPQTHTTLDRRLRDVILLHAIPGWMKRFLNYWHGFRTHTVDDCTLSYSSKH